MSGGFISSARYLPTYVVYVICVDQLNQSISRDVDIYYILGPLGSANRRFEFPRGYAIVGSLSSNEDTRI